MNTTTPRVDPAPGAASTVESDPVDELAPLIEARVGRPVDALQVAAALEAAGIVDRTARDRYGYPDVFQLAEEVYARIDAQAFAPEAPPALGAGTGRAIRDLSHGLLYVLPAALLPALPPLVGAHPLMLALVTASGLGWVWSAGSAWLAYRLLGRGLAGSAGRVLRGAALVGTASGAVSGGVIAVVAGGGARPVAAAAGLLAFQMAAAIALVYRREVWLTAAMVPGVAAGLAHLALGRPGAGMAAAIGCGSVLLALAMAVVFTSRRPPSDAGWSADRSEPPLSESLRPELGQLGAVVLYAGLSAAFLLQVDVRYFTGRLALAVAAAPLIVGMGVVEWRTRRFHEQAGGLLHRTTDPKRFGIAVWGLLVAGLLGVLGTIGTIAAGLIYALDRTGRLDAAAAVLILAHVVVGGAYFLAFVVAGQSRYLRLSAVLAAALIIDVAAVRLWPGTAGPLREGVAMVACGVLIQALLALSLRRVLGQAWRYRGMPTLAQSRR